MNLKGTKTEKNVQAALAGESIARNKYTFYAMEAKKNGDIEISNMFEKMAKNETFHAKVWFNYLNQDIKTSEEFLMDASHGENMEWMKMYPEFAATAREEGLEEIAKMFDMVANIEKDHERQFLKALIEYKVSHKIEAPAQELEEKKHVIVEGFCCQFCGAKFEGARPDVCTVCAAIGAFENCKIEKEV